MKHCSHCGQLLPELRAGRRLPPLKARLFDLVKRAGAAGIATNDLYSALYPDASNRISAVKVHVAQINTKLTGTGVRISGAGGRYRLITPTARVAAA
jgi:hypothetical protein